MIIVVGAVAILIGTALDETLPMRIALLLAVGGTTALFVALSYPLIEDHP